MIPSSIRSASTCWRCETAAAPRERVRPPGGASILVEPFLLPGFRGEVTAGDRPGDLAREVARIADPGAARRTLHWGRNYLYTATLETPAGPLEVVVKQFRNQGWWARLRRRWRGSKAERSWRVALAMRAAGIPTPAPVMLLESAAAEGPSYYVSRHLPDVFEARHLFRALAAGREGEEFPGLDAADFLAGLGGSVRRLHDAGFWHRDLSPGNLLVQATGGPGGGHPPGDRRDPRGSGAPLRPAGDRPLGSDDSRRGGALAIFLVDLNRTRVVARISENRRLRDLARLPLVRAEHQEALLRGYRGHAASRGLRYPLYAWWLRWKNPLKRALRAPFGGLRDLLPRRPHVHLPPPPAAGARDRAVWDRLSDQPHQHAGRWEKAAIRLRDAPAHLEVMAAAAGALPRIWRRYRRLARKLYREPAPWGGEGVAIGPSEVPSEQVLAALDELGARNVLLRLHPWEEDQAAAEDLARELHRRGYDLAFALPQSRELVRDPARWRAAVAALGERFLPYGRRFQLGQAINRSKWGVWNLREYLDLAAAGASVLREMAPAGGVEILGPAVIDFELHVTAAALNMPRPGLRFDVVSSLLYVDRRGAPENRQSGFDTVGKVTVLKAIAETARSAAGRSWITEVNWPLWEGPHSPAGRRVTVDEETQADYLVRYYLLALGTGLVERVYWWQLAARGYGLLDPEEGSLRRRPAFRAYATLIRQLAGAERIGPLPAPPPARLLLFRRPDGSELVTGWSVSGRVEATLPRPPVAVFDRDGRELPAPGAARIMLQPSPRYFLLQRP